MSDIRLEVRTKIYHGEIVMLDHKPIDVRQLEPADWEPKVLRDHEEDFRMEAWPAFYQDNFFILHIKSYDIRDMVQWLKTANYFRSGAKCLGTIKLKADGVPNWENLVEWLRLMHGNKVVGLEKENCEDQSLLSMQTRIVMGVFKQVKKLATWEVAQDILPGIRETLGATDPRWLEDGEASGTEIETETEALEGTPPRARRVADALRERLSRLRGIDEGEEDGAPTQATCQTALATQILDGEMSNDGEEDEMRESHTLRGVSVPHREPMLRSSSPAKHSPELGEDESQDYDNQVDYANGRW